MAVNVAEADGGTALIRQLSAEARAAAAAAWAVAAAEAEAEAMLAAELADVQQSIAAYHSTGSGGDEGGTGAGASTAGIGSGADAGHPANRNGANAVGAQPPDKPRVKVKGATLLPHEQQLLRSGALSDVTHVNATSIWLTASSIQLTDARLCAVYRPMGDAEFEHLLRNGALPDTQPYQTIVEGEAGRRYSEKYLRGHKKVDSSPTTVVEFVMTCALVQQLFAMQQKIEDGVLSHGLGSKGGRGLPSFNACLKKRTTEGAEGSFRVVLVKRPGTERKRRG
jgi:hypothetical protein